MGVISKIEGSKVKGIYIHIPFCLSKCPYCDFVSGIPPIPEYFSYLFEEIKIWASFLDFSSAKTIYFGGGTPSLFPRELERIFNFFLKYFEPEEVTVEANPENFSPPKFATRISFGIQSFSEKVLRFLGRSYDPHTARKVVEKTLPNFIVNTDFMFGVPGQSPFDHLEDLKIAVDLNPHHISTYLLTIYEGTRFEGIKTEEDISEFFDVQSFLEERYKRYEISNFARDNFFSKHNLIYWKREDFIGFGVSAYSKISRWRFGNTKNIKLYMEKIMKGELPISEIYEINFEREIEEEIFLGLRLCDEGVSLERFGIPHSIFQELSPFLQIGERIRIKKEAIPVMDEVIRRMVVKVFSFLGRDKRESCPSL